MNKLFHDIRDELKQFISGKTIDALIPLGGPGIDEFKEGKSPPWEGQKKGF